MNLKFKEFNLSDLLPSDIIGYTYLKNDEFVINKGQFLQYSLADELSRASQKLRVKNF